MPDNNNEFEKKVAAIALKCGVDSTDVENYTGDESLNLNADVSSIIVVGGPSSPFDNIKMKMNLTSYGPEVQKCFQDSFNNMEKENKKKEELVVKQKKEKELKNKLKKEKEKCLIVLDDYLEGKTNKFSNELKKKEKDNKILIIIVIILFTIGLVFTILYFMKSCDNELDNDLDNDLDNE